jgi:hypothetical protein
MAISGKEVQSLCSRLIISHGEKENELSLYHVKRCKADERGEIIAHRVKENALVLLHAKRCKADDRGEIIAHREKENALVLLHAKRCKADDRGEIIAHRVKENILGYFTQRHKDRTSSTSRKEAQSRTGYYVFVALCGSFVHSVVKISHDFKIEFFFF